MRKPAAILISSPKVSLAKACARAIKNGSCKKGGERRRLKQKLHYDKDIRQGRTVLFASKDNKLASA